ncbi:hypothetical protein I0P70_19755 [Pontibacter sp. FD36]|uniref:DUF6789 family protein n=1 Tax=Pontibacter sp. FD36 TaxID=2789860 RepID=UPI0018AC00F1|nr:DUF6789 family protein [Pontibacter sp. FD36]MBF8965495.1 hypothetical protein [Pontibacter sp. FD36]
MKPIIIQVLKGGLVGTGLMTIALLLTPLLGLPYRSAPSVLAEMMGVPLVVGWITHFVMGIFFALAYAFLFLKFEQKLNDRLQRKISSKYVKGVIFGVIIFACSQVINLIMKALFGGLSVAEENKLLLLLSSLAGHIIFGIIVALFVRKPPTTLKAKDPNYKIVDNRSFHP